MRLQTPAERRGKERGMRGIYHPELAKLREGASKLARDSEALRSTVAANASAAVAERESRERARQLTTAALAGSTAISSATTAAISAAVPLVASAAASELRRQQEAREQRSAFDRLHNGLPPNPGADAKPPPSLNEIWGE
jgi:hypothetical protein